MRTIEKACHISIASVIVYTDWRGNNISQGDRSFQEEAEIYCPGGGGGGVKRKAVSNMSVVLTGTFLSS